MGDPEQPINATELPKKTIVLLHFQIAIEQERRDSSQQNVTTSTRKWRNTHYVLQIKILRKPKIA